MIAASTSKIGIHVTNTSAGLQTGGSSSQGSVYSESRTIAATKIRVTPTTWLLKPRQSMEQTSFGYFRYSTNKRLGRTSYSAMNPGVAASMNKRKAIEPTTQIAVNPCHASHRPGIAEIGANNAGIKHI